MNLLKNCIVFLGIVVSMACGKAYAQQTLIDVTIDSAAILIGEQTKLHLTVTAAGGEVAIHSVADEGTDGLQAEVGGNLSDGTARLRVAGDGGEARWTLTEVGGAMVAQGCARADGSWQRIEGVYASRGIYLLMVSDGQVAKTIKLAAR